MTLGENLRALRLSRNMTQQQAAERLGVTRQAVSGYESNRTRPDIDMLQTIAALYGTDLAGVVDGAQPVLKARRGVKSAAVVFAALLTAMTAAGAAFLWSANRFFPLTDGAVVSPERLESHARLASIWEGLDAAVVVTAPVGGLLLLAAVLALRCRFSLKQKLTYQALLSAGLLLPGLLFGWADPVFSPVSYLTLPFRSLCGLLFLLLILLAAESDIRRREARRLSSDPS